MGFAALTPRGPPHRTVMIDTGLAILCALRHMAWHGRLSRVLDVLVAPLTGATPFLLAQERCAKEGHPTSGFRFAQLPSLRCRSGGRLTWAIPGPLSLSPHPCGSSPYATPPLGLLTGPGREPARFPQNRVRRRLFLLLLLSCDRIGDAQIPFRRPSGITVEGVERHGCRESCDGPGMALRSVPLER